jgi:DNA-binding MarR family transcriptional regulator
MNADQSAKIMVFNKLTHQEQAVGGKRYIVLPYTFVNLGLNEIDIRIFFKLVEMMDETDCTTVTRGDLARMLKHSRSSVVISLKKMERLGIVRTKKLVVNGITSKEHKYELFLPEE